MHWTDVVDQEEQVASNSWVNSKSTSDASPAQDVLHVLLVVVMAAAGAGGGAGGAGGATRQHCGPSADGTAGVLVAPVVLVVLVGMVTNQLDGDQPTGW